MNKWCPKHEVPLKFLLCLMDITKYLTNPRLNLVLSYLAVLIVEETKTDRQLTSTKEGILLIKHWDAVFS